MNDKTIKLIELIKLHPDIPIIILSGEYTAITYDARSAYLKNTIYDCFFSTFCEFSFYGYRQYVLELDKHLIVDHLFHNVPRNKILIPEKYVQSKMDKLKWSEAIFIRIAPSTEQMNHFM